MSIGYDIGYDNIYDIGCDIQWIKGCIGDDAGSAYPGAC